MMCPALPCLFLTVALTHAHPRALSCCTALVWIRVCRYSDAHVLKDGSVAVAFQKTFDPPVPSIEGGGYDVGLAIFKTKSKTETRG